MEGFAGVTAIDTKVAAVTVRLAEPLIEPDVALMVLLPAASAVARPPPLTVAVNCCCWPAARDGFAGVTAIDTRVAAVTVRLAEPLIEPDVALMVLLPAASAVARPPPLMVAVEGALEVQVAVVVRV